MRIADVRAFPIRNTDRDGEAQRSPGAPTRAVPEPIALVVVEVATSDGATGAGTVGGFCAAATEIIRGHLRDLLIGEDARDVERLWEIMYRATLRYGGRGAAIEAISGVDIALWDLLGRTTGLPVFRLLGGRTRASVPVYASHLRDTWAPDRLEAAARADVAAGFPAVKLFFGRGPDYGESALRQCVEVTRLVRAAIGEGVDLMVDPHLRWDVPFTLAYARGVADLGLRWIEEPIHFEDRAGYARLTRALDIPIAAGEHEYTRYPFVELVERGCVTVLQPDVNRVGGITEARRIVGFAAAHGLPVCFHQGWLHSYHLVTSFPNCPIGEYFPPADEGDTPSGNALNRLVLWGEPEAERGHITIGETPGFGWRIDSEAIDRFSPTPGNGTALPPSRVPLR